MKLCPSHMVSEEWGNGDTCPICERDEARQAVAKLEAERQGDALGWRCSHAETGADCAYVARLEQERNDLRRVVAIMAQTGDDQILAENARLRDELSAARARIGELEQERDDANEEIARLREAIFDSVPCSGVEDADDGQCEHCQYNDCDEICAVVGAVFPWAEEE